MGKRATQEMGDMGWQEETIHEKEVPNQRLYRRGMYMITMATEGRKPILGTLKVM